MATNRVNLQEIEPSSRRVKTVGLIIKRTIPDVLIKTDLPLIDLKIIDLSPCENQHVFHLRTFAPKISHVQIF